MELIEDIKIEEGFSGEPYKDHLGFDTIGYGTKLPLDVEEAELLLRHRLGKVIAGVNSSFHNCDLKPEAWDILYQMAYQMGLKGLLGFRMMKIALERTDYVTASEEMLDSKWAKKDTPARAARLAEKMRYLKG